MPLVQKPIWPWRLKILAMSLAFLTLDYFLVIMVMKIDGKTSVADWSWFRICLAPCAIILGFACLWMTIHYFSWPSVSSDQTIDVDRTFLQHAVSAKSIEAYHEIKTFRDLLLLGLYTLIMVYCGIIYNTPCESCNTPYKMLSLGCALTYGLRSLYVLFFLYFDWYRLRLMSSEIRRYQHSPKENERRLFQQAFCDIHRDGDWRYAVVIHAILVVSTLILAFFGTLWIENGDCMQICGKQYYSYKYLLVCLYCGEAFFIISLLLQAYLHRTKGVADVESIIDRHVKVLRLKKKQQASRDSDSRPLLAK